MHAHFVYRKGFNGAALEIRAERLMLVEANRGF